MARHLSIIQIAFFELVLQLACAPYTVGRFSRLVLRKDLQAMLKRSDTNTANSIGVVLFVSGHVFYNKIVSGSCSTCVNTRMRARIQALEMSRVPAAHG